MCSTPRQLDHLPVEEARPSLRLKEVIRKVGLLLPAQGPISVFVHHNTLHAFEDQPFEDAVISAGRRLGCEPFLSETRYRAKISEGRIENADLEAVLRKDLGTRADDLFLGNVSRHELRLRILTSGIPESGDLTSLRWLLSETEVLSKLRAGLPAKALEALTCGAKEEATVVRKLWISCRRSIARSAISSEGSGENFSQSKPLLNPSRRHRDLLLEECNIDLDKQIHPVLIRFVAGFLDQGMAHWQMPERDSGLYSCFLQLHGHPLARLCGSWSPFLQTMIREEQSQKRDGWMSLQHSLHSLGLQEGDWEDFLSSEALALRGWAGMVRQLEQRPDLVPVSSVPARLVDFLAIRLLLTRAVLNRVQSKHDPECAPLNQLHSSLGRKPIAAPSQSKLHRAWHVFHVAQICGLNAHAIDKLSNTEIGDLEEEISAFPSIARRRVFHLAFEQHLRHRLYDALIQHQSSPAHEPPLFQAIFCLDDREESFRRHLEEVDPRAETFGAAGFYGVAMYFRGQSDAHPRALCPVAIKPEHYVSEVEPENDPSLLHWRDRRKRFFALLDKNIHFGSQTFTRGAVIMATIGVLWLIPLVLRVLFPRLGRGSLQENSGLTSCNIPLQLNRTDEPPPIGRYFGYTTVEMAKIVHGQLAPLGILSRLSPLVFVFGHGSMSLNNPQRSAHDCGACGGGQGGPNAHAFAQMANDPDVRAQLVSLGVQIPKGTWFVGGLRNTVSNDIVLYDEDLIPSQLRPQFARAKMNIDKARRREAQERCRRFASVPSPISPEAALLHVQARSNDLAQPRTEYGHASSAFCIVGRRRSTKSLFLDRRAFLTSYDPTVDSNGALLASLLAAVVPVVVGINLEYYFGYTDPSGYGCGTKLPHNVTSLLGVMNGSQSDLRTGLPWQMLEIHEPVRLTMVVEAPLKRLERIVEQDEDLRRLVQGRWLILAALDPVAQTLHELDRDGVHAYQPGRELKRVAGPSLAHFRGQQGHLPFVQIAPDTANEKFAV